MTINCVRCGRPVCVVDVPEGDEMTPAKMNIAVRTARGLGFDLTEFAPQLDVVLNPTPEKIATAFNVRCASGC